MLSFTWDVFSETGNIETYLLYKEIENERQETPNAEGTYQELASIDFPII